MKTLARIGTVLWVVPFAVFGVMHFVALDYTASTVPSFFPAPTFWALLTGAAQVAFVASVALGRLDRLASVLLALMLLVFVVTIHVPKAFGGDFVGIIASLRDTAMAGAALVFAATRARDSRLPFLSVAPVASTVRTDA
jgi:uncharacterized membrane protein YphA (DoxX/SURF4 family)